MVIVVILVYERQWNACCELLLITCPQSTVLVVYGIRPIIWQPLMIICLFCPMHALAYNARLIHLLILALYTLFACLLGLLTSFFLYLFFLTYLLPYLLFPLKIGPLHFQARGCKRPPNVGLSYFSLFWVIVFLCSWWMVILRCSEFSYLR